VSLHHLHSMAFRSRIQSSVRWGFHCALRIPRLFDAIGVATVGFSFSAQDLMLKNPLKYSFPQNVVYVKALPAGLAREDLKE
jgi:hypothetical protein